MTGGVIVEVFVNRGYRGHRGAASGSVSRYHHTAVEAIVKASSSHRAGHRPPEIGRAVGLQTPERQRVHLDECAVVLRRPRSASDLEATQFFVGQCLAWSQEVYRGSTARRPEIMCPAGFPT